MTSRGREVRHLSVFVDRRPADVYAFAVEPANLPRWARGLGGAVEKVGDDWVADSPSGRVKVRFAPRNDLGVLDHDVVVLGSGATFHVPMRVVASGEGSDVVFTLFREPGTSDAQYAADGATVERDLRELKRLLER